MAKARSIVSGLLVRTTAISTARTTLRCQVFRGGIDSLHQIVELQRLAFPFPRSLKLLLNKSRVILALLLQQNLMQSPQGPRIPRIPVEVIAKHFFRTGGVSIHPQRRAQ